MADRRIRHTKQRLEDALLDLLQEKHISAVSVTELCSKADINRNTFYAHYQTPTDLLQELEHRYYQDQIQYYDLAIATGDARDLIRSALNQSAQNDKLMRVINDPSSGSTVRDRLNREAAQRIIDVWVSTRKIETVNEVKWMYAFVAGGVAAVLQEWASDGQTHNADEVFAFIEKATQSVLGSMFNG